MFALHAEATPNSAEFSPYDGNAVAVPTSSAAVTVYNGQSGTNTTHGTGTCACASEVSPPREPLELVLGTCGLVSRAASTLGLGLSSRARSPMRVSSPVTPNLAPWGCTYERTAYVAVSFSDAVVAGCLLIAASEPTVLQGAEKERLGLVALVINFAASKETV